MSTQDPGESGRRGPGRSRTPDGLGTVWHLRPVGTWTAVGLTLAVLVATNLAVHRWGDVPGLVTAVLVSVLLLAVLHWADGTWDDAGLAPGTFARGARWALTLIGLVGLVYLAGALLPATRTLFEDQRYEDMSGSELLLRAFVLVPVGTVLLEEIAFRGVLYGLVRRARGVVWATVVSSLLFGLWHVLPSLHLAASKPALNSVFGDSAFGAAVAVMGAVLFTAAAGVLFCELRRRSGSLLAPMGLHWAVNALGYLFGFLLR
ncbi:CPBP family intramembrane metalloprotease [Streptomyces phaeoluteigriseus]|uniref:CPBP family intramembrane metalloprotease n=1 Tax=Streptomyces phaeoluteigriseus TaxID=114686 RepID=A0ABY4Z9C1_9ACTN|nr:type II CAAX endopeptidase family protein [Streptomyces phaeoluteigriseus]USQ85536.1 CPBP family intramembrane metalloprotease [Streptomyces phaeoluteigriseus]